MRNLIRAAFMAATILLVGAVGSVSAQPGGGNCPTEPSGTKVNTSDGSIAIPGGTLVCVKASNDNTGIMTANFPSETLAQLIVRSGLLNNGEQVPNVSNYVTYGSPEHSEEPSPSAPPTPTPSDEPTPSPSPSESSGPSPYPSESATPSTPPTAAPSVEPTPSTVPSTAPVPAPTAPPTDTAAEEYEAVNALAAVLIFFGSIAFAAGLSLHYLQNRRP